MFNIIEVEETIKLIEEAKASGEEVEIQCPNGITSCDDCPLQGYCGE